MSKPISVVRFAETVEQLLDAEAQRMQPTRIPTTAANESAVMDSGPGETGGGAAS